MDSEKLVKSRLDIDIEKDVCYACAMPENKMFTYHNIKKINRDQIVLEPTGQYSRATIHALVDADFRVLVMNRFL